MFAEGQRGWVQTWHTRRSVSSKSSGFISCIHPAKSPSTPRLNQTKRQVAELSVDHVQADQSDPPWLGSWWGELCRGQPRVKRNHEGEGGAPVCFTWSFEKSLPSCDWTPVRLLHQSLAAAAAASSWVSFSIRGGTEQKRAGQKGCSGCLQCVALQPHVTGILQSLCGLLGNAFPFSMHLMPTQENGKFVLINTHEQNGVVQGKLPGWCINKVKHIQYSSLLP